MNKFLTSSIGSKFVVAVSGIFLLLFLVVHLTINAFMLIGSDIYNEAAHFMATNPAIKVMEPVLALGFIVHIFYATWVTLRNQGKRPVNYKQRDTKESSTFASQNMFVLGALIFIFLVLHIANFFLKLRYGIGGEAEYIMVNGVEMHDTYSLVHDKFTIWWYSLIYVLGAVVLGFHLSHGFWSSFQTVGWSGTLWRKRFEVLGTIFTIVIAGGFALIPIVVLIQHLL